MKVIAKQNRDLVLINAQNTQNENDAETILLQVPEKYEDFVKKIAFITPNGVVWDVIENNEYLIKKAITKYEQVQFYIWLTKDDVDFRTKERTLKFNVNHEVEGEVTPEEQSDMERVISILDSEIIKVNNKEKEINDLISTIQTKLDNGEFNGKDGVDGKDGQPRTRRQRWCKGGKTETLDKKANKAILEKTAKMEKMELTELMDKMDTHL